MRKFIVRKADQFRLKEKLYVLVLRPLRKKRLRLILELLHPVNEFENLLETFALRLGPLGDQLPLRDSCETIGAVGGTSTCNVAQDRWGHDMRGDPQLALGCFNGLRESLTFEGVPGGLLVV